MIVVDIHGRSRYNADVEEEMGMVYKMTFEAFMICVNAELRAKCGMDSDEIDDWSYRSDFDNGVAPKRCAARAIKNASCYDSNERRDANGRTL